MPLNPTSLALLNGLYTEENERLVAQQRRWNYYYGDQDRPLVPLPDKRPDDVRENVCRPLVDGGVDFLFGGGVRPFVRGNAGATQFLADMLAENNAPVLLTNLAVNGGVVGHWFLKLVPADEADTEFPRVVVMDPSEVSVVWDEDDIERVLEFRVQHMRVGSDEKLHIVRHRYYQRDEADGVRHWRIEEAESTDASAVDPLLPSSMIGEPKWRIVRDEAWPYAWCPVVAGQNLPRPNEYWGEPDLTDDLLDLQDSLNRTQSNINRILRFHAHPLTVLIGTRLGKAKVGPDRVLEVSEGSDVKNVEMQSDLASSRSFASDLERAFWLIARSPSPRDVAELQGERVTNFRVRMLFQQLYGKTKQKRALYGRGLTLVCKHALELAGYGANLKVELEWGDPLPRNETEDRANLTQDQGMGVASRETIAMKLGYDWPLEKAKIAADDQRKAEMAAATKPAFMQQPQQMIPAARRMMAAVQNTERGNNGQRD